MAIGLHSLSRGVGVFTFYFWLFGILTVAARGNEVSAVADPKIAIRKFREGFKAEKGYMRALGEDGWKIRFRYLRDLVMLGRGKKYFGPPKTWKGLWRPQSNFSKTRSRIVHSIP
ncbi:MAG: hypothetical protein HY717_11405 [Planctomycetes bacterium]|nr:hypothetical protein [Planctomycetota bacterium]